MTPIAPSGATLDQSGNGSADLSVAPSSWRFVTDAVMGGVSVGTLGPALHNGRLCLRLQGQVRTANGGGFIKARLKLTDRESNGLAGYDGLLLDVCGNAERYNLHLHTTDMRLPWQSYRKSFFASVEWTSVRIPFADLKPHRISAPLCLDSVAEISLLAIGREFSASLSVSRMSLFERFQ